MDELTYSVVGDYRLPNLAVPEEGPVFLGKYALLRKKYLRNHHKILFVNLLTAGTLNQHLMDIEQTANERLALITGQMAAARGVTEELKAADQMAWVGAMNNIRACAEELVFEEVVYA